MRYLLGIIIAIILSMMLEGCAQKEGTFSNVARNYLYGQDRFIFLISSDSDFAKNKWAFQLQEVSEYGLKHGFRYFAIRLPNRISNTKGSPFNTFEEINKFCSDSFDCGENSIGDIYWEVEYFKKQPIEYVTYDSKAILKDLKKRNLYFPKIPKKGDYDIRFSEKISHWDLIKHASF